MTHTQTQGADGAGTKTAGEPLDLRDLHAANIARQAEWCPDQVPDLSFRGNELGGECGEAQNVIKKLERERQGWRGSRATKDDLADELADVVICADLCAVTAGIDLGAAVRRKFNATSEKQGLSVFLPMPSTPATAATSGVPDSVRKAIAFAAEAEGAPNGRAARRYAGLCCLQWVETLLSPQADKQTEPPALCAVVEVYPDRTDTRLTFGDRIQPEPGVKAVQQAIAALTAEYEARGGCPVVGRHPSGQSAGTGAETDALVDRFSAALKAKLRAAEAKYGWQNGWLQEGWAADCQRDLLRHVRKGDPLDVAAYAAFCWHHGWPTAPNSTPVPAATPGVPDSLRALSEGRLSRERGIVVTWDRDIAPALDRLEAIARRMGAPAGSRLIQWAADKLEEFGGRPAGQAGDAGASPVRAALKASMDARGANRQQAFFRDAAARIVPAPNSIRTGAAETEREAEAPIYEAFARYVGNADERASDFRMFATGYHAALAARPEAPSDAGWSREDLEAFVAREWPEGRSAGAAARELVRALGVRGLAPTLQRLLTDLLGQINFASTDRAQILADFANAAPEAARMAKIDSFERWNPRVFDPTPPSDPARPEAPSDTGWRETFETIAQWCEETFGPITPERIVSRAGEEMDELRAEPTRVEEAADVLICLARYPGLWAAVERKMKVNRGRKWRLMGDGTGYHIKPTPPSDPAPSGQAEG